MSHDLLALLPQWGPWLLAVSAFLSCMMVPVPTSALLLTAGALSGTGHLHLPWLILAAVAGASLGDLTAFSVARRLGPWLNRAGTKRAVLMARAHDFIRKRGLMAVFLSRWLITPLGPAINYVSGAAGMALPRFALASVSGEVLWAVIHLTLGHLVARNFRHDEAAAMKALAVGLVLAAILYAARKFWRGRRGDTI
ncbi:DedA family protein [Paracoccus caeni]|uniref:DedA family protein n=1 Tax=Paracoccus caeni TaxID=657651 RepID=A0A934SEL0_9RHOB|nr:DedA family protein [Paracoccus caeni]MBK4215546.1 DedA family protein [Paracoccus caeni]